MRPVRSKGKTESVAPGSRLVLWTAPVLLLLLFLSLLAAVTFGTTRLSVVEVYAVIRYELAHLLLGQPVPAEWAAGTPIHDVVWLIRLPRLVLGAAVGAALSLCGVVMQAVVKNPLADPYVLGISSGAAMGATLAVLFGVGSALGGRYVGGMAFLGAVLLSFAVLLLANLGGRATAVKLLLSGSVLSAVCSAVSDFALYLSQDDRAPSQILRWTRGGLGAASWPENGVMLLVALGCTAFFLTQCRTLNLMLLGEDSALTLGVDLHRWQWLYLVLCALLVGLAVYNAGIIGFVGLIIPHGVRMCFGSDHRRLIPVSVLAGAIFLVWADVLCRVILPGNELPIGILTALLGAPMLLFLLARRGYGFGGDPQ